MLDLLGPAQTFVVLFIDCVAVLPIGIRCEAASTSLLLRIFWRAFGAPFW